MLYWIRSINRDVGIGVKGMKVGAGTGLEVVAGAGVGVDAGAGTDIVCKGGGP